MDPPVDVELGEAEPGPEAEAEALLPLPELLVPDPVPEVPAVLSDDEVAGLEDEVTTQGDALAVAFVGAGAVPDVLDDVDVSSALAPEEGRPAQLDDPVAMDPEPAAVVPLPSKVELVLSVTEERLSPEAPVDGPTPAPPALSLCRCLIRSGPAPGASPVAASLGALDTVASTTPTIA